MRQTDRQTSDLRQKHRLMPLPIRGGGIVNSLTAATVIKRLQIGHTRLTYSHLLAGEGQLMYITIKHILIDSTVFKDNIYNILFGNIDEDSVPKC